MQLPFIYIYIKNLVQKFSLMLQVLTQIALKRLRFCWQLIKATTPLILFPPPINTSRSQPTLNLKKINPGIRTEACKLKVNFLKLLRVFEPILSIQAHPLNPRPSANVLVHYFAFCALIPLPTFWCHLWICTNLRQSFLVPLALLSWTEFADRPPIF